MPQLDSAVVLFQAMSNCYSLLQFLERSSFDQILFLQYSTRLRKEIGKVVLIKMKSRKSPVTVWTQNTGLKTWSCLGLSKMITKYMGSPSGGQLG